MQHYSGALNAAERAEFLPFVRHLAAESGALIRRYFRSGYRVEFKADASPVTVADRGAEELLRDLILRAYPDHGILGEEYGAHNADAEYTWVLDPIDGTKAFVTGTYLWGTLIALKKHGRPALGVIHQPVIGDFLVGVGDATWLNDQPAHVTDCARIEDAIMLTTDHWQVFTYQNGQAFEALTRRARRYNNWGDCHGYHLVATGGAQIMGDPIMNTWDLMALIPIVEGAGGVITDWQGNDPVVGVSSLATSSLALHAQVLAALNPG